MSKVKVTMKPNWSSDILKGLDNGLFEEVTDIDRRSDILAPKLSGNLVESDTVKKTGELEYTITYGSSRVPYARKRFYENKLHPETVGYLKKAADAVQRGDEGKYYRGKV